MQNEKLFLIKSEQLDDFDYYKSPFEDQEKGFKVYPGLKELKFWVHTCTKIAE